MNTINITQYPSEEIQTIFSKALQSQEVNELPESDSEETYDEVMDSLGIEVF